MNGIIVESKSNVPTWFGRIIGINKISVSAKATACSPCTVKPLDIMLVLDRTGSMCTPSGPGGSCPDLNNARQWRRDLPQLMDPSLDKVGLAVLPPALDIHRQRKLHVQAVERNCQPESLATLEPER